MFDSQKIQLTHPLYKQFADWQGVDGYLDSNYHMINYSLHAATSYMESLLGVHLYIGNITIDANKINDNNLSKVLSLQGTAGLLVRDIEYIDSNTGGLVVRKGTYNSDTIKDLKTTKVNGVVGYVFKTPVEYNESEYKEDIDTPKISLSTKLRLDSPYIVDSTATTLEVIIYGKPTTTVEINEVVVGVVGDNSELVTTLDLKADNNTFRIKLIDTVLSTTSDALSVLVTKVPNYTASKYVTILGYDTVVSASDIRVIVSATVGSTIRINTVDTLITSDIQVINVPKTVDANGVIKAAQLIKYELVGTTVKGLIVSNYILDNNTDYLDAVNIATLDVPHLPYDLQVAMFKLAKHLYSGTLYNSSNVETAQSMNGERITYLSHSIPKDVMSLLSPYIKY